MPRKKAKKIKRISLNWKWIVSLIIIFVLGVASGYFIFQETQPERLAPLQTEKQKNVYLDFLMEIYDKIQENFWDKITDEQLSNLFKLGTEKLIGNPVYLKKNEKEEIRGMLNDLIKKLPDDKKKEFSVKLGAIVLANLKPAGRSGLYTQQKQKELTNKLQNINPEKDLYKNLEIEKEAGPEEIKEAFEEKIVELETKKEETPEIIEQIEQEIEETEYAFEVLSDQEDKQRYDQTGAEPTVFAKLITPKIYYIRIQRISPVTFGEFQKEANKIEDKEGLDTLILDLRGNIGGSIDLLPYFLGPFIGKDRYAFDFFQQGEYTPFKTVVDWLPSLVKYKKVVILIDEKTQSSAEVMAATFKKYNVGVILGRKTLGWGTVEKIFELENQIDPENETYSMFLVHSITLRDDGQPIEGRGIDPTISIDDPNWEKQLLAYFNYQELVEIIKELWKK